MNEEEEYYAVATIPVDELVHTDEHAFCDDMSCPCKEDQDAIGVVAGHVTDGLMTPEEATRYYQGGTI